MTEKHILITGAGGMLGRDLVPFLQEKGYQVTPCTAKNLDLLASQDEIIHILATLQPDVVVNCAAYTNVDKAEEEPELAMGINRDGVRKLAIAAKAIGAVLVHISTDFVFNGTKNEPYTPSDMANPLGMYGKSKYEGEVAVAEVMETFHIVRTSWLYGVYRKNFTQFVLDTLRAGKPVKAASDMIGSPTWTGSLCQGIETVMNTKDFGIHHVANQGWLSRYEQACRMAEIAGLDARLVQPITAEALGLNAKRPLFSVLDTGNLQTADWEEAFRAYLAQYTQLLVTI